MKDEFPLGELLRNGGLIYVLHIPDGSHTFCNLWDARINYHPRNYEKESALAADFMSRFNEHSRLTRDRDALLLGCKAFVRWVDDCWGASEILHPETRREYEAVKIAIKNAEKSR